MTITQYIKEIKYNRYNKDYDMILDNEYVGSAATHHEAEVKLDELVYTLLQKQPIVDTCPFCGDPLPAGARLSEACVQSNEPAPPDLATDLYNVVCLVLSGAAATTAISELRRVQARYESEVEK